MPLIATRGAASAQGFGEFAQSGPVNYIEDVFSTYLYTGNGSSQTITNGIDLAGKGGLVWFKERVNASNHVLLDTLRGGDQRLQSNTTAAQATIANAITSFNSNGFTLGASGAVNAVDSYVSWTFREQAKFFDVVTWTGNGDNYRNISHNLKSTPGCVIVKSTSVSGAWAVWHRSTDPNNLILNSSSAAISGQYSIQDVTSSNFGVANSSFYGFPQSIPVNDNGATYVAYLFAHNAGGFGTSGSDNVITCGSYTGNGSTSGPTVTLGYEPQWLLIKRSSGGTGNWVLIDSMRGFVNSTTASPSDAFLVPNTTAAEQTWGDFTGTSNAAIPLATGFQIVTSTATLNNNTDTYIYIAIRRGPMKTPTTGTSVFTPVTYTGDAAASKTISTGKNYVTDWLMTWDRTNGTFGTGTGYNSPVITRLTGFGVDPPYLKTNEASSEGASVVKITLNNAQFDYTVSGTSGNLNGSGLNYINWNFGRAPGFFDVVCYTGTGSQRTVSHNLGVVPELIIVKSRNDANDWAVYSSAIGNTKNLRLNTTAAESSALDLWASTTPSATTFTVTGTFNIVNGSTVTYVAYLFASVAGVSKVGSYTGTGTTLQVNCGFTNGSRFVLIKRTDSTGDWYVWDSARGIVAGNDPYIRLNSTAAEVTNTDYVDTFSSGFEISSTAPAAINANGGTFIFLAVA